MIMSMKELKQLLFQERMKALNEVDEQRWNRDQLILTAASVDKLRKQVEKLNNRIDELQRMVEQNAIAEQKAVNEYDQA